MTAQYSINATTWTIFEESTVTDQETGYTHTITREHANLHDHRGSGREYINGAERVRVDGKAPRGKNSGPFRGETAWMDAERLASDICFAIMYGRYNHQTGRIDR